MARPLTRPALYRPVRVAERTIPERSRTRRSSRVAVFWRRRTPLVIGYVLLIGGAIVFLMPIFWMVSTALKPSADIFAIPIKWFPVDPQFSNFVDAWRQGPFPQYFYNSVIVALCATVASVLVSGFAGYALAKLDFYGKKFVFLGCFWGSSAR